MKKEALNRRAAQSLAGLIALVAWSGAQAALQPPPGYTTPIHVGKPGNQPCETPPAPFTGTLDFPSKYEGSDSSRDEINPDAEARYKSTTDPITTMEKGFSKLVGRYMTNGDPSQLACAIRWIDSWASARALMGDGVNHTGKSMRKWALGSFASSWVKLKFRPSAPLAQYPQEAARVEAWFGTLAIRVALEWSPTERIDKINNHYYWAAWSLMATAVATDRRELFDDALATYRVFAKQVDAEGYLPNELKRATRAANYHNYSMLPLSMIAAFAKANGVGIEPGLNRLAVRAEQALVNPSSFDAKAGVAQEPPDPQSKSNWSWLEPYCWAVNCSASLLSKRSSLRPLGATRLGGDLTSVFDGDPVPKPPVIVPPPAARELESGLGGLNQLCRDALERGALDETQRICKRTVFDAENMAYGSSAHVTSLLNMGDIKARIENFVDADAYYSSALQLVERAGGAESDQAADILTSMIEFKVRRGKFLDAATLAKRVLAIREKNGSVNDARVAVVRARYADLLSQSHQFPEAQAEYGRAIGVLEHAGRTHAETFALTVQHLGEMFERRAQYRQAEVQYRRVVSIVEQYGLSYRLLAGAFDRVAYACEQQDKTAEAASFYRRAIDVLRGTPTPAEVTTRIQARLSALSSTAIPDSARAAAPSGGASAPATPTPRASGAAVAPAADAAALSATSAVPNGAAPVGAGAAAAPNLPPSGALADSR